MKAFLLAAGVGSRLRPITDTTPKCLLPVGGQSMLDIWLNAFATAGVDEVLVNTHHLAHLVCAHLERRDPPPAVRIFHEPELLGSAGTLIANRDWVKDEDFFLVANADSLTNFELQSLIKAQHEHNSVATLGVFRSANPAAGGVLEADSSGTIIGFEEKPEHPVSDLVNAGIYAFQPRVLDDIEGALPKDIGYHLLPRLVYRARILMVDGYFQDIGTPDAYRQAMSDWGSL